MCITTLVSIYRSTYRRVYEGSEMEKGVYGRAVLYTGGQRDCAQEGSGVVRRRVAWLCAEG